MLLNQVQHLLLKLWHKCGEVGVVIFFFATATFHLWSWLWVLVKFCNTQFWSSRYKEGVENAFATTATTSTVSVWRCHIAMTTPLHIFYGSNKRFWQYGILGKMKPLLLWAAPHTWNLSIETPCKLLIKDFWICVHFESGKDPLLSHQNVGKWDEDKIARK